MIIIHKAHKHAHIAVMYGYKLLLTWTGTDSFKFKRVKDVFHILTELTNKSFAFTKLERERERQRQRERGGRERKIDEAKKTITHWTTLYVFLSFDGQHF